MGENQAQRYVNNVSAILTEHKVWSTGWQFQENFEYFSNWKKITKHD